MGAMASQITSLTIVYSTVYSDADQRKHQSSASQAFVRGIHRGPVNSPHKWPVTRKMFPFDDVIMGNIPFGLFNATGPTKVTHAGPGWSKQHVCPAVIAWDGFVMRLRDRYQGFREIYGEIELDNVLHMLMSLDVELKKKNKQKPYTCACACIYWDCCFRNWMDELV